jgi:RNA polymerase sigma-70 factor (ECF subfamily)
MIREMNRTDTKISRAAVFFAREKESFRQEFEEAALPHLNHIYRAAYYLTRNEAEADDLVQDTYLKAYRCFYQFQPGTNCRAWLLTILRSLFLNQYDRKKRQPEMVDWDQIDRTYEAMVRQNEQADAADNPETLLLSRVTDTQVTLALKRLPEEYRAAIVLVDVEDLTYDEAAQVMQCPVGTVRSRISRGRRMLQVALKDYASERGFTKS